MADADEWYAKAEKQDRSWWLHWEEWVQTHSTGEVAVRQPGIDHMGKVWQLLGDAPGEYVNVRADEALNAVKLDS